MDDEGHPVESCRIMRDHESIFVFICYDLFGCVWIKYD